MLPWRQYFDLKGQPPPKSIATNVTVKNVKGTHGAFGAIQGTEGQTELSNFTLENVHVELQDDKLKLGNVSGLVMKDVVVNGKPYTVNAG